MKRLLVLLALITLILAVGVFAEFTETDDGKDFAVKGTTTYSKDGNIVTENVDLCRAEDTLLEYFCDSTGKTTSEYYHCVCVDCACTDIEKPVEEVKKPTKVRKYDLYGYVDRIPLRGVRRSIAKAMVKSKYTAPHVTTMDEADVTELWKIREKEKKAAEKKGIKLTILPFIVKAVVTGLKEHPYLNASLNDEDEEIILKKYYNIGFATDTPEGLMVPVVKNAADKSILQLAEELTQLAEKARNRKIDLADLKGGTFTITNYGALGGIYGTPIINHPEVAILGLGKMKEMPVAKGGKIVVRKILALALSFDHRVVDGAEAARFLNTVIARLEDPDLILLET